MQDEHGSTEGSMSSDKHRRGALSYFLPAPIPNIPHDIARKVPGIQVAQVHNDTCMAKEFALLIDMLLLASKDVVHHDSMLCFCLQLLAYVFSVSHRQ